MTRAAFVAPRAGEFVNGGAELLCRKLAARMSLHWEVEILTTCALDYVTWEDHFPEGEDRVEGVLTRRFPVDAPRDIKAFDLFSQQVVAKGNSASLKEQEKWMRLGGPMSTKLLNYIKDHEQDYDLFFFYPYLYATTYFALPLVREKACLVPCAHDEWTIYLPFWKDFFKEVRCWLFNTPAEKRWLQKFLPEVDLSEQGIAGLAVDPPVDFSAERFRKKFAIEGDFLLYVGRIDPSKGCQEMFDYYQNYRKHHPKGVKLLLMGKAVMELPKHEDIISLGFVEEQDKWDGLAASKALVMPSYYESFSMVLLESWLTNRPVLVNGRCEVLLDQTRRAHGGLWYENAEEFSEALTQLFKYGDTLGKQGHDFSEANYYWPSVEEKYFEVEKKLKAEAAL